MSLTAPDYYSITGFPEPPKVRPPSIRELLLMGLLLAAAGMLIYLGK